MLISVLLIGALRVCPAAQILVALKRAFKKSVFSRSVYHVILVAIVVGFIADSDTRALMEVPPFNSDLEKILQLELSTDYQVSCQVIDLDSGHILMEKNPNLPLTPASTLKVVTVASALSELGPDYRFPTNIYTDELKGGSVGNIFVKGHGDPHLVTEELFALVREMVDKGLTEVRGSIVVDDSYFQPDSPLDDTEDPGYRSYDACYSALSLNFNSLKISAVPGVAQTRPARLLLDPPSDYASISGHVNTTSGDRPLKIEISKKAAENDTERVIVQGSVGINSKLRSKYINVRYPSLYTGYVLKNVLSMNGVKVAGDVVQGLTPDGAIPYIEHQSIPLGLIVYWLGKLSNNFMAEQICLAMGAHAHGAPGTREKGLDVMRKFLLRSGVTKDNFSLSDASGLSRSNRISASALVKTLVSTSHNFYYSPEFISALGISGVDGTLKEKFIQDNTRRRIRAKTGTLRGVNALAGFGLARSGKPVVFAILVNSEKKGAGIINYADRIISSIFNRCLNQ
ncbi:MAG: D-alanyl-D-alanine carboxypeptidase/D-alanyl-D-alanine-endopeptidase [Deltaproteobacteria bacterium]|nr:D-alanyl-D-alanine carboxypeptidase/D-alanyl-D-alanine-endopeptidase [Deltaproteobacteria bacterium]